MNPGSCHGKSDAGFHPSVTRRGKADSGQGTVPGIGSAEGIDQGEIAAPERPESLPFSGGRFHSIIEEVSHHQKVFLLRREGYFRGEDAAVRQQDV